MRLQLTEQWPSVTDTFVAADESGQAVYTVKAKTLSLRDKLTVRDSGGQPVATVQAGLLGGWGVSVAGQDAAKISSGRLPRVELLDGRGRYSITGDVSGREYKIADRRQVLATVSKSFFSLTDRYGLDVPDPADALLAVAVAVALHRQSQT